MVPRHHLDVGGEAVVHALLSLVQKIHSSSFQFFLDSKCSRVRFVLIFDFLIYDPHVRDPHWSFERTTNNQVPDISIYQYQCLHPAVRSFCAESLVRISWCNITWIALFSGGRERILGSFHVFHFAGLRINTTYTRCAWTVFPLILHPIGPILVWSMHLVHGSLLTDKDGIWRVTTTEAITIERNYDKEDE